MFFDMRDICINSILFLTLFYFIVTLISGDLQDGGLRDEDAGRRVDAGETN